MTEVCDCGFEAKNERGLSTHQRSCDEVGDESPDSDETPQSVSTADALSEREEQAMERDEYECRKCGSDENLTVHEYREDRDRLANMATLCEECVEQIEPYHHLSQRNYVRGIYE